MLNTFPDLLFLGPFSPFLIRITVGILFIWIGYLYVSREKTNVTPQETNPIKSSVRSFMWFGSIVQILIGILLIAGLFTQMVAIIAVFTAFTTLQYKKRCRTLSTAFTYSNSFYILLLVASLSLLFSGAGMFALDLPL